MRFMTCKKVAVAYGDTPKEFEANINSVLANLAEKHLHYEINFNTNEGHCAYIVYEEQTAIAETVADEYELKGETYLCKDCPYFKAPADKRRKNVHCELGKFCSADLGACDEFYEKLSKGQLYVMEEDF